MLGLWLPCLGLGLSNPLRPALPLRSRQYSALRNAHIPRYFAQADAGGVGGATSFQAASGSIQRMDNVSL